MIRRHTLSFLALLALASLLASCGGGGGSFSGGGNVNPTSNPTSTPGSGGTSLNEAAFQCPSSDTSLAHSGSGSIGVTEAVRRAVSRSSAGLSSSLLAVSYASDATTSNVLDAKIAALGAKSVRDTAFTNIGRAARVVRVVPGTLSSVQSALHAIPGVSDVSPVRRLSAAVVNGPYMTNDPYFEGYASLNPAPLYQTSASGGQWDMHIVQLEHAFAYSQSNNGSGVTNANALGSTSVKLAIVDTGEDVTHPDLAGATIARSRCFLTDDSGNSTTGTYVTDGFGHGTDVTGIASAVTNNSYGFSGDAGNVSLMLYRVFPTPDDNCANPGSSDDQCGAADVDIASAINDAVANGANVINLSLGQSGTSGQCVNGRDPSTVEGNAIANAIAANVVVVASAGNDGLTSGGPIAPACDTGVIAAGASAYNDGNPNGSNYTGANHEYVASYTDVSSSNNTLDSASSWGIMAPGGDPGDASTCTAGAANPVCDTDDLHWIENIWTTTPYQSSSSDQDFVGTCGASTEFGEAGDCRTLIAGTSMASPHVAGAAALILSVNSAYQSPAKMKQLLCETADDIKDPHQGCGRLNVYNAMAIAVGDPVPPTPAP